MKKALVTAGFLAGALVGCQSAQNQTQNDREHLAKTEQQAAQNINKDRADAVKDKDRIDERLDKQVADQREDVAKARAQLNKDEQKLTTGDRDERGIGGSGPADTGSSDVKTEHTSATRHTAVNGAHSLTGTLASASGSSLTLRDENGQELKLKLNDATRVTQDGKDVKLDAFREGTAVRASWVMSGEDRIARQVEVLGSDAARK